MKSTFTLIATFICLQSFPQISMDEIDLAQIHHKKIKNFILEQKVHDVNTITDIVPTCTADSNLTTFKKQEKNYIIKDEFSAVWAKYLKTSPAKSWEGSLVKFGMLISKPENKVIYRGGEFQEIKPGQVIFLDLRLLKGIYHLAMAFEIINIDRNNGIIEFSYIKGNKSRGMQRLKFMPTPEGYTQIIHSSFYKSQSALRDKVLYPFFHKKATNEFHRNLRKQLKELEYNQVLTTSN